MAALFAQHFGVNASGTTPTPPPGPPIPPAPPVTQPDDRSKVRLKEFLKMNPPAFRGKKDPTEAEEWLTELRIIFDFLGCTDAERVSMSAYMLKGRARDWWGTTQGILMSSQDMISWDEF